MQKCFTLIAIAAAMLLASGCAVHKPDIQQGQILAEEVVAQLKPGMSEKEVLKLLGTPLISDPFHQDRWDYLYITDATDEFASEHRLTLHFSEGTLVRLEDRIVALP